MSSTSHRMASGSESAKPAPDTKKDEPAKTKPDGEEPPKAPDSEEGEGIPIDPDWIYEIEGPGAGGGYLRPPDTDSVDLSDAAFNNADDSDETKAN